ncbi:unnamed protein product [Darwinula stevensoni]|uniref:Major facilitator superfamily (MFS) profile domain-containing protein n=1 Tax=Darwinula stevensoni TaxID=69355 RepID=A0A7R9A7U4_9CRUS|nr:unnamed protein product [Darwinula stevensoni]CAG0893512.1 unnamed protein product [Darwinula stevensoni]
MSRETVSEAAALVSKEVPGPVSYTMEGGRLSAKNESGIEEDEEGVDEVDFVDTEVSVLSHFHEDAISQAGFGCFQWILLLVVGLGLAADTVELFVVAYVLPSAEVELCLDDFKKGWLGAFSCRFIGGNDAIVEAHTFTTYIEKEKGKGGEERLEEGKRGGKSAPFCVGAITFFGMMIGGFVWGGLADRLGRRRTLLSSLSVNAAFGAIAAFMPTYGTFMTSRLCSGIGIGGSLPIVFAYFSEFLTRKDRGRHMSWLLMAWAIGGVFVALMAWAIIPKTGVMVVENEKEHFSRWREFLLVCSLPSFLAVIGLIFMPESPRFLLDTGRDVEAMMVYQKIYKSNHAGDRNGHYSLSELELPVPKPPSRKIMPPPAPGNSALADFIYSLETVTLI